MTGRAGTGYSATVRLGAAGVAAALLRCSFTSKAGSARFYLLTTSLAGVWAGGALGAGPVPWRGEGRSDRLGSTARGLVIVPVVSGAATFALFYGTARAVRRYRSLRRVIGAVL